MSPSVSGRSSVAWSEEGRAEMSPQMISTVMAASSAVQIRAALRLRVVRKLFFVDCDKMTVVDRHTALNDCVVNGPRTPTVPSTLLGSKHEPTSSSLRESIMKRSQHLPTSSEPMSSLRPRMAALPHVAILSTS